MAQSPASPLLGSLGREPTKREKKRAMLSEKLNDMVASFAGNKQSHYTAQLSALQCDINLILRSDPYAEGPLDDSPEEIRRLVADARDEITRHRPILEEADSSFANLAGTFYSRYVDKANESMEERDTALTLLHAQSQNESEELFRRFHHSTQAAKEEHAILSKVLRERLIYTVNQRKTKLLKDKEQLDIADSNALLLHPSQFSLGNPASPGGIHGNRKTRNTRLRPGDSEEANGSIQDNKRKRKAPYEDENDSSGPTKRAGDLTSSTMPYADQKAKLIYSQFEAPLYSIDRLFTEKELDLYGRTAHDNASKFFLRLQKKQGLEGRGANGNSIADLADAASGLVSMTSAQDGGHADSDDDDDDDANHMLGGAASTQTAHATRSSNRGNLVDLANVATAPMPTYVGLPGPGSKSINAAPPPPGLAESEIQKDLELMQEPGGNEKLKKRQEAVRESCVKKYPPLVTPDLTSMGTDGDRVMEGDGPTIAARVSAGALLGGIPMSKASSMQGISDTGGLSSTMMRRSGSGTDFNSRRQLR